jgi:hypothetical protein
LCEFSEQKHRLEPERTRQIKVKQMEQPKQGMEQRPGWGLEKTAIQVPPSAAQWKWQQMLAQVPPRVPAPELERALTLPEALQQASAKFATQLRGIMDKLDT